MVRQAPEQAPVKTRHAAPGPNSASQSVSRLADPADVGVIGQTREVGTEGRIAGGQVAGAAGFGGVAGDGHADGAGIGVWKTDAGVVGADTA